MEFRPYTIEKNGFRVSAKEEAETEITMYGEIVEERPYDWWTGEQIEGDFIIQNEILEAISNVASKKLTLRLNSLGGDAGVSILIHNKLRELQANGKEVTCIIDGVAMSGGSLIMCACDNVKVNPSSLIMIHKCWSVVFGQYNADNLRTLAESFDAWDKAQVSIYTRKTGLSDTVISHMMGETTYMTGKEAIEKGFADELIEDETLTLAASADRSIMFVNGRAMRMPKGMEIPEGIPVREEKTAEAGTTVSTAEAEDIDKSVYSDTDELTEGGQKPMATNLEELRAENAELAQTIEAEVRTAMSAEQTSAVETSVANERNRLAEIDEIASLFTAEQVREAKYGDNPCTAQELAFRAAKESAKSGNAFLANAMTDAEESGVNEITSAPVPEASGEDKVDTQEKADAIFAKLLKEDK